MNTVTDRKKALVHKVKHATQGRKPDNWLTRLFSRLARRFGLPFGIALAIFAALLLTTISMTLYFVSGTSKLDLSRPGYESAREQIRQTDGTNQNFSASGEIDSEVIKDFLSKYDKEAKDLSQYSTFNESILGDQQLGITEQQTAPSDGANP